MNQGCHSERMRRISKNKNQNPFVIPACHTGLVEVKAGIQNIKTLTSLRGVPIAIGTTWQSVK